VTTSDIFHKDAKLLYICTLPRKDDSLENDSLLAKCIEVELLELKEPQYFALIAVLSDWVSAVFSGGLLDRAILLTAVLSVRPSVPHACKLRLNGSRYRNTFTPYH